MMDLRSVGEVPAHSAARWKNRTALIHDRRAVSFQDLDRSVSEMRSTLQDLGIVSGQRVAIYMENRPEYLHAYFAIPAAGAVTVPLNTFLAPPEIHEMLRDCGAAAIVGSPESLNRIGPALLGLPELRQVVVCGGAPEQPPEVPFHLNLTYLGERAADVAGGPGPASGDDAAVILYTSGTTGRPKGVLLTHRNLLSNAKACIEAVGVDARDRILLFLPMFHAFSEMVCMLAPALAGMSVVLCGKLDRAEIRRAIIRHRPTIFPAVPAVFAAMAQARVGPLQRWLNPVRLYVCGGAPLSLDTLRAFEDRYRRPLCEGYGLSEAAPVVTLNPPAGPRKPGSIGLPLPGVETMVVDDGGRPLPPQATGELLVRGPGVMKGYYRRPDETARALDGGWLRTGDLARKDEDGYLFIMGRIKEMLICRGMNIYPREIEEVLEALPQIREAAVIGVPDPARGEVPFAFVVARDGQTPTEMELKRACQERLARYKVPRAIRFLPELPRNAAGKVLKESLKGAVPVSPRAQAIRGGSSDRAPRDGR